MASLALFATIATGQSASRDTTAAYSKMFCASIGAALPFLHFEDLHVPYMTESEEEYNMVVDELWKNAFTRVGTVRHRVVPIQMSYHPSHRFELGLGCWWRSSDGTDAGDAGYSTASSRVYLNTLYRPPLKFSRRLRPVLGLCVAWDSRKQVYEDVFSGFYPRFTCTTRSLSLAGVAGLHISAGRMIFGVEANALGLCYIQGDWNYQEANRTFEHWLGQKGVVENDFVIGPITGRMGYSF